MGASIFFRGIRSWEADGPDERRLQILNTWGPLLLGPLYWPIPTVFLQGDPEYNDISSTLIRDVCRCRSNRGDDGVVRTSEAADGRYTTNTVPPLTKLVPASIAEDVGELYGSDGTANDDDVGDGEMKKEK